MTAYPYAERFEVMRAMPEEGRNEAEVLAELNEMATEEDAFWETGKCSGTMYCGDHEHYAFMNEAFGKFAHMNTLQRDMCPSATRFEGEIIAMTLDLMHADAVEGTEPVGLVTSGGSGSIAHAVLAYRDQARSERGIEAPNFVKPETGHPAFDKACHLFGVELRTVPVDPVSTVVAPDTVAAAIEDGSGMAAASRETWSRLMLDPADEKLTRKSPAAAMGCHVQRFTSIEPPKPPVRTSENRFS